MADKIKLDEGIGYTEFENSPTRGGSFYQPTGPLGRFFAKFFATKAQKEIAKKS